MIQEATIWKDERKVFNGYILLMLVHGQSLYKDNEQEDNKENVQTYPAPALYSIPTLQNTFLMEMLQNRGAYSLD